MFNIQSDDADTGGSNTTPLCVGDVIFISGIGNEIDHCYISADGFADNKVGVNLGDSRATNVRDCLFRVTNQLSYSARDSLEVLRRAASVTPDRLAYEEMRADRETEKNVEKLSNSQLQGVPVHYGQTVQLQHVKSSKFLTLSARMLADVEKECMRLSLSEGGNMGSWLKLMPRFRFRSEGATVHVGDQVMLECERLLGSFVRCDPRGLATFMSDPQRCEVNVKHAEGGQPMGWRVQSFSSHSEEAERYLQVGQAVRIYHAEADSFVAISCAGPRAPKQAAPYLMANKNTDNAVHVENMSAKQIFVIEMLDPECGGDVHWYEQYRLRHVGSGKYLAIKESVAGSAAANGAAAAGDEDPDNPMYECELVDNDEESEDRTLISLLPIGGVEEEHRGRVAISGGGSQMRIQHVGAARCWMHNSGTLKTTGAGETKTSRKLGFCTRCLDQDALQIVLVDDAELLDTENCISRVKGVHTYMDQLYAHKGVVPDEKVVTPLLEMLTAIIHEFLGLEDSGQQGALGAVGIPSAFKQRIAREVKLMDALFHALAAPFTERGGFKLLDMERPNTAIVQRAIRYIYKTLSCTFLNNRRNEEYVARQSLRAYDAAAEDLSLMRLVIQQLVIVELGGAACLTSLITNNTTLLQDYVDDDTIMKFVELIREKGPDCRFLAFLQGLASCQGAQIVGNQEILLRVIYSKGQDVRYLQNRSQLGMETALDPKCKLRKWASLSDETYRRNNNGKEPDHGKFLGQQIFDVGMHELVVSWYGSDDWTAGQDHLFHSPKALKLPTTHLSMTPRSLREYTEGLGVDIETAPPREWTRLELISWTQDPEQLYPKFHNNAAWPGAMNLPDEERHLFEKKKQLADFYEAQIDLYSEMCLDRSYNCIEALEGQFSYEMLVTAVVNPLLPHQLRASFARFLCRLYIVRYPHERIQAPEYVRVWDHVKQSATKLTNKSTLPQFRIEKGNPLLEEPDPFYSHPDSNKFHLLEDFISDHFDALDGKQLIYDKEGNIFTVTLLDTLNNLACFGFYGTVAEIVDLCNPLIGTLDGRADVIDRPDPAQLRASFGGGAGDAGAGKVRFHRVKDGKATEDESGVEMSTFGEDEDESKGGDEEEEGAGKDLRRYKMGLDTNLVMDSKMNMCKVLNMMADIRCDFRLTRLLYILKQSSKDGTKLWADQKPPRPRHNSRGGSSRNLDIEEFDDAEENATMQLTDAGQQQFQSLFEGEEADALDLDKMSDAPLITVCLDLLMYESADLFEAAFTVIVRHFTQRSEIVETIQKVHMLAKPEEVSAYGLLKKELSLLRNKIESYEVWGVENDFSPISWETVHQVKATLVKLRHICTIGDQSDGKEANWENQDLLRKMEVHTIMLRAFEIPSTPEEIASGKGHLQEIKQLCVKFITMFTLNNPANQILLFPYIDQFVKQLVDGLVGMEDVFSSLLKGNRKLCVAMPESVLWSFAEVIETQSLRPRLLGFFMDVTLPNPAKRPVSKNQERVMKVISSPSFKNVMKLFNEGIEELGDTLTVELVRQSAGFQRLLRAAAEAKQTGQRNAAKWTQHVDPTTNRVYWYNKSTRESRWEQPIGDDAGTGARGPNGEPSLSGELNYHMKLVELLSVLTKGKSGVVEVKCQRLMRLEHCLAVLLEDDLQTEIKTAYLAFFWETFLETEMTVHARMASHPHLWQLLDGVCYPALVRWADQVTLEAEAQKSGADVPAKKKRSLEEERAQDFLSKGVLPTIATFFSDVWQWDDVALQMEFGEQVGRFKSVIRQLSSLGGAASSVMEPEAFEWWTRSAVALRIMDEQVAGGDLRSTRNSRRDRASRLSMRAKQSLQGNPERAVIFEARAALKQDNKISKQIVDDFDKIVLVLNNVAEYTDPGNKEYQDKLAAKDPGALADCRTAAITFEQIIRRAISHVRDCVNSEPMIGSLTTLQAITDVLCRCVVREMPPDEDAAEETHMSEHDVEMKKTGFVEYQRLMNSFGASELVVDIVACKSIESDDLVLAALELGRSLLSGGNSDVQESMLNYLENDHLRPDDFFEQLGQRFLRAQKFEEEQIEAQRAVDRPSQQDQTTAGLGDAFFDEDEECEDVIRVDLMLEVLSLMCEGHNLRSQDMLRDQMVTIKRARHSRNLMEDCVNFLHIPTASPSTLRNLEADSVEKIGSALDFLIEALQGPCKGNQSLLAGGVLIDCCRTILSSGGFKNIFDQMVTKSIKAKALKCLVSLVEGRTDEDKVVERILIDKIDHNLLRNRLQEIHRGFVELSASYSAKDALEELGASWDEEYLDEGCDLMKLAGALELVDSNLKRLMSPKKLGARPTRKQYEGREGELPRAMKSWEAEMEYNKAHEFFTKRMRSIEVFWNGALQRVLFLKPSECIHFSEAEKTKLKYEIDFGHDERLKEFVDMSEGVYDTMTHKEMLMNYFVYKAIGANLHMIKNWSYVLALMMNVIMLLSLKAGYISGHDGPQYHSELFGLGAMTVLMDIFGSIQFVTSTLVLIFLLANRGPLIFKSLQRAKLKRHTNSLDVVKLTFFKAFKPLISVVFVLGIYGTIIYMRFATIPSYFGLVVAWAVILKTLPATRIYLDPPDSKPAFYFCALYDVLTNGDTLFYVGYEVAAILARFFRMPYCYTYHLMDVVVMSETLKNVVRAVTNPIKQLAMTTLLGFFIMYMFTVFLFYFFQVRPPLLPPPSLPLPPLLLAAAAAAAAAADDTCVYSLLLALHHRIVSACATGRYGEWGAQRVLRYAAVLHAGRAQRSAVRRRHR
jgi:hypothetical protein